MLPLVIRLIRAIIIIIIITCFFIIMPADRGKKYKENRQSSGSTKKSKPTKKRLSNDQDSTTPRVECFDIASYRCASCGLDKGMEDRRVFLKHLSECTKKDQLFVCNANTKCKHTSKMEKCALVFDKVDDIEKHFAEYHKNCLEPKHYICEVLHPIIEEEGLVVWIKCGGISTQPGSINRHCRRDHYLHWRPLPTGRGTNRMTPGFFIPNRNPTRKDEIKSLWDTGAHFVVWRKERPTYEEALDFLNVPFHLRLHEQTESPNFRLAGSSSESVEAPSTTPVHSDPHSLLQPSSSSDIIDQSPSPCSTAYNTSSSYTIQSFEAGPSSSVGQCDDIWEEDSAISASFHHPHPSLPLLPSSSSSSSLSYPQTLSAYPQTPSTYLYTPSTYLYTPSTYLHTPSTHLDSIADSVFGQPEAPYLAPIDTYYNVYANTTPIAPQPTYPTMEPTSWTSGYAGQENMAAFSLQNSDSRQYSPTDTIYSQSMTPVGPTESDALAYSWQFSSNISPTSSSSYSVYDNFRQPLPSADDDTPIPPSLYNHYRPGYLPRDDYDLDPSRFS
ncbi:hypothetical protein QCA50_011135 [Cerrena zonata]|uniref:C2H2-type domain-containing protein n=1 Tax=Cerrena zonata TaxID=2478898 RepID=A0AAW0G3A2_9APHY